MVGIIILATIFAYLYYTNSPLEVYYTVGWLLAVVILLLVGNSLISRVFDKRLPWLKYGAGRLITHLLLGILYSLVIINLAYLIFKIAFTDEFPTIGQLAVTNVYGTVIFIPAFCIYVSFYFLRHWQQSVLEAEAFKKETLKSELDNLKNHLDPHFLFNNLNILSSLIDYSQEESKVFLDKFADVYRAILKTKQEDLIELQEEMHVIDSYIYLLKTRFEDNILFDINITPQALQLMLPPLTVQMLVENAIKHNVISEKRPLQVSISSEGSWLIVENSLYEKPAELKDTGGSGLDNIRRRYHYFTEITISVEKSTETFIVKIPLVEVEQI